MPKNPDSKIGEGAISLSLTEALLDEIARRAAALMSRPETMEPEPWITVEQAAEHMACPKEPGLCARSSAGAAV